MIDFTLEIYKKLLTNINGKNYKFLKIDDYFSLSEKLNVSQSLIIMRHDVDRKPQNALKMAKLEHKLGVKATYYFRTISQTLKPEIIKEIAELGHEIGYHYECLAETKGDYKKAIQNFEQNLTLLRGIFPVNNIAMHGRPTSKWDSRLLWKKYDYKKYGVLSEPYFDIDFNEVLYVTDAGRSWNNKSINLRDKVDTKFKFSFNSSEEIIAALEQEKFPDKIMFNIHPEHWTDSSTEWVKIWVIRKIKNSIKKILIMIK